MSIVKIAHHAGVSTATVSRVLNNFPHVGAETARQVRASAEALNYTIPVSKRGRQRNIHRLRHSRRQTNSIAILTIGQTRDWLQLPVMAAAVAGISRGAREYGLCLMPRRSSSTRPNCPMPLPTTAQTGYRLRDQFHE